MKKCFSLFKSSVDFVIDYRYKFLTDTGHYTKNLGGRQSANNDILFNGSMIAMSHSTRMILRFTVA